MRLSMISAALVAALVGYGSSIAILLAAARAYKDELIHVISEPPISEAQLPPKVSPPGRIPRRASGSVPRCRAEPIRA